MVQCFLRRQHARTARPPTANGGHVVEQGLLRGGLPRKLSPVASRALHLSHIPHSASLLCKRCDRLLIGHPGDGICRSLGLSRTGNCCRHTIVHQKPLTGKRTYSTSRQTTRVEAVSSDLDQLREKWGTD